MRASVVGTDLSAVRRPRCPFTTPDWSTFPARARCRSSRPRAACYVRGVIEHWANSGSADRPVPGRPGWLDPFLSGGRCRITTCSYEDLECPEPIVSLSSSELAPRAAPLSRDPGLPCRRLFDADFFRQAQRLDEKTYKEYARPVLEFLRSEYPHEEIPTPDGFHRNGGI